MKVKTIHIGFSVRRINAYSLLAERVWKDKDLFSRGHQSNIACAKFRSVAHARHVLECGNNRTWMPDLRLPLLQRLQTTIQDSGKLSDNRSLQKLDHLGIPLVLNESIKVQESAEEVEQDCRYDKSEEVSR